MHYRFDALNVGVYLCYVAIFTQYRPYPLINKNNNKVCTYDQHFKKIYIFDIILVIIPKSQHIYYSHLQYVSELHSGTRSNSRMHL